MLTIVVRGIVNLLLMGWTDRLAGLSVAGAAITGLADLTYNSDPLQKVVSSGGLESKLDAEEVREGLESYLMESALVDVYISVTEKLPANALGFVPPT